MTGLLSAFLLGFRIGVAAGGVPHSDRPLAGATAAGRMPWFYGVVLSFALLAALAGTGKTNAAGVPEGFTARTVQLDVFARDSIQLIARCEMDKVFLEHRKLGFFRVKLLPVLVAQGVRVEFTQANPQTNWVEGFRFNPAPTLHARAMEWRDFQLFFPGEKSPRLRADRVIPAAPGSASVCRLEGIQLATSGGPVQLGRGELNAMADGGAISWRTEAAHFRWDLLTGQCTTNSTQQSTSP